MKNFYKILLVDDEENALGMMELLLSEMKQIEIVGKFADPYEALEAVKKEEVIDAVFLDIEMPELSGIELAEEIKSLNRNTEIVFVTAYSDYAVKAFELFTLDYLLKPVLKDRLKITVERLIQRKKKSSPLHPNKLIVKFLKKFEIYVDDRMHPLNWRTYKVKELCAFFFHHSGKFLDKDLIIDAIWRDTDYEKAKVNFYTCVSYLRKMMKSIGYNDVIIKNGNGYQLLLKDYYSDVESLELLMEDYRFQNQKMNQELLELLEIYEGNYMEENDYEWSRNRREDMKEKYLFTIVQLGNRCLEDGFYKMAISFFKKAIELDPYSEKYYQYLIHTYLKVGQRSEAIKLFHEIKRVIDQEFGVELSFETIQLYESINQSG